MISFKEFLVEEGILDKAPGEIPNIFGTKCEDAFCMLTQKLGLDRDKCSGPEFQEYENMSGIGGGNHYKLPSGEGVRFNNSQEENDDIKNISIFDGFNSTPIVEISFDLSDVQKVIDTIMNVLSNPKKNDFEVDVIVDDNEDSIIQPIDSEEVTNVSEEGKTFIVKSKKIKILEEGKYSINDKTLTEEDAVKDLWQRGYNKDFISNNLKIEQNNLQKIMKSINIIKTIDVRPGKPEKITKKY